MGLFDQQSAVLPGQQNLAGDYSGQLGNFNQGVSQNPGAQSLIGGGNLGGLFGNGSGLLQQQQGGLFSKIGNVLGSPGFASGMGAFNTLATMYTGFKALGLAKDQLSFQKKSFNRNFAASAKAYNNEQRERYNANAASQRARGGTMPVSEQQWLDKRSIDPGPQGG